VKILIAFGEYSKAGIIRTRLPLGVETSSISYISFGTVNVNSALSMYNTLLTSRTPAGVERGPDCESRAFVKRACLAALCVHLGVMPLTTTLERTT